MPTLTDREIAQIRDTYTQLGAISHDALTGLFQHISALEEKLRVAEINAAQICEHNVAAEECPYCRQGPKDSDYVYGHTLEQWSKNLRANRGDPDYRELAQSEALELCEAIDARLARIASLEAQLAEARNDLQAEQCAAQMLVDDVAVLKAKLAESEKDAERYRWLESRISRIDMEAQTYGAGLSCQQQRWYHVDYRNPIPYSETLSEYIDSHLSKEPHK